MYKNRYSFFKFIIIALFSGALFTGCSGLGSGSGNSGDDDTDNGSSTDGNGGDDGGSGNDGGSGGSGNDGSGGSGDDGGSGGSGDDGGSGGSGNDGGSGGSGNSGGGGYGGENDTGNGGTNGGGIDVPKVACVDEDSDGWCVPFDCKDDNPNINPGVVETKATPYDDNCDGSTKVYEPKKPNTELSYIWIANSDEGTVSKVNTKTMVEEARYRTCPYSDCDPSRTSVNLYGDMVVTNRFYSIPGGKSSVTKIRGFVKDCKDKNKDGHISTSQGPNDVLAWGEDECVVWNQKIPFVDGQSPRARATAWDGSEDAETGKGGYVLIGTCLGGDLSEEDEWKVDDVNKVFFLNGDTGKIDNSKTVEVPNSACLYGGAIDPLHHFWVLDGFGFPNNEKGGALIEIANNEVKGRWDAKCGYGITADQKGNIWLGGKNENSPDVPNHTSCVQKFNSTTKKSKVTKLQNKIFLRGIAVGAGVSDGYAWAAESLGHLYRIDTKTMNVKVYNSPVTKNTKLGCGKDEMDKDNDDSCDNGLVGAAVDWDGYVWVISTTENSAYKFDPKKEKFKSVEIGEHPYTYSDMTGMQLRNVIIVH